jgi:hypothetical protein
MPTVKPGDLEKYAITTGALISLLLAILASLNMFQPLTCPIQGIVGLISATAIGVFTSPIVLRRTGRTLFKDTLLYTGIVLLTTLVFWPVLYTALLLLVS